ncbi:MAG: VWA domain-containing protein [Rhodocyclaceae bacterium]|nr:VWA domain-containing protein [Rhodocyclaceae bacterium]
MTLPRSPAPAAPEFRHPQTQAYWKALDCRFQQVADVFEECLYEALASLSRPGIEAYVEAARTLGKLGRGADPVLAFLEAWPDAAEAVGEASLPALMDLVRSIQKSPNGPALVPLLQTLAPVARRLRGAEPMARYLAVAGDLMARTTGSIHGFHQTQPSPGLPEFFRRAPELLAQLSVGGLAAWTDYGIRNHGRHPDRQREYFSLASADSRAVLQRERHGTLFADVERRLDLSLRALWDEEIPLAPYPAAPPAGDGLAAVTPYLDAQGMRLPDVQDDRNGVRGVDRYRLLVAHMAGHRRWSAPLVADNYSPFQRLAIECFEDCRIDTLLARRYPGLAKPLRALHPVPREGACDPATESCLRHRLAMLSRAMLDPDHAYADPLLQEFTGRFREAMAGGDSSTRAMADIALAYVTRSRRQSDQLARVFFTDTVVDYRDDNRHLWTFIETGDEEESFDQPPPRDEEEADRLPPRHYPEWDYRTQGYRPDWVSVYESLHPSGRASEVDALLAKHAVLARRLKRLLDLLKPQERRRVRFQEDGAELDLDVALRSWIDFRGGTTPDPRINMSHETAGRDLAVLLLLDLSESLNDPVPGTGQTVLELSREAVSLLAWAIGELGDRLAIAGFRSNTRHDVRYQHLKGYSEPWGDPVKARLAATGAAYSTRMGAALRHGAHYLAAQRADRRLLLVLTDGRPSDVDAEDDRLLVEDTRRAVLELEGKGIRTHCISLDGRAEEYVHDIFGGKHSVVDRVERLPERLPMLFLSLTR